VASQVVVIHERLGSWARQLRPRLRAWPIRWVESRSTADLVCAVSGMACPIVVIGLDHRPRGGLEDLDRALQAAPQALVLVLDPNAHAEVATLARELGATQVCSGVIIPPAVAGLLARWLPLARRRTEDDGWSAARPPEPEPWNWLASHLAAPAQSGAARAPGPDRTRSGRVDDPTHLA
jgi:hypothetical protein